MFGIGSTELLVILVVALIVLGPKSLAGISRTLGKAMGEFRRVSTDFQRTLNAEAAQEEEAERRRQAAAKADKAAAETMPAKASQAPETPDTGAVAATLAGPPQTATESIASPTPSATAESPSPSSAGHASGSEAQPATPPADSPLAAALAKTRAEAEALSPQSGDAAPTPENGGKA